MIETPPNGIGYMVPDMIMGKPNPRAGTTDISKTTVRSVIAKDVELINDQEAA